MILPHRPCYLYCYHYDVGNDDEGSGHPMPAGGAYDLSCLRSRSTPGKTMLMITMAMMLVVVVLVLDLLAAVAAAGMVKIMAAIIIIVVALILLFSFP